MLTSVCAFNQHLYWIGSSWTFPHFSLLNFVVTDRSLVLQCKAAWTLNTHHHCTSPRSKEAPLEFTCCVDTCSSVRISVCSPLAFHGFAWYLARKGCSCKRCTTMTLGFSTRKSSRYSSQFKVISHVSACDTMFIKYVHLLIRFTMYSLSVICTIAPSCLLTLLTCGRKTWWLPTPLKRTPTEA